ncbi:von willebrand factor [Paraphaeosphaeria sporulosa]
MSVSPVTYLFDHHRNAPPPSISQHRGILLSGAYSQRNPHNMSMFGSLKKKLSRRGSNPLSQKSAEANTSTTQGGYLAPSNSSSFTNPSPATRRPSSSSTNPFARPGANDPPPAYTPGPTAPALVSRQPSIGPATDDDPYAFLRNFDTVFLIDDSGSMAGSRWGQVEQALSVIAPICAERDEDGIDVYFLNNKKIWKHQRTAGHIIEIFQDAKPGGQTFTGKRLYEMLTPYLARYKKYPANTKPVNIIVVTDGQAHDDVAGTIQDVAKKLDRWEAPPWQVGIQFFQIGNDPEARNMLKQLDDELAGSDDLRDIVDTVPFTSEAGAQLSATGIMKVVLGSVNRRLDRNSKELHR